MVRKMKLVCNICENKIKNLRWGKLKKMGIRRIVNYPFGKHSKVRSVIKCYCGGMYYKEDEGKNV